MKTAFYRIMAILLIIAAVAGLIFSLGGILAAWVVKPTVTSQLVDVVELANSGLDTTAEGLVVAELSLKSAITSVNSLENTILTTANTVSGTTPMLETLITLTSKDLPKAITSAQTSLSSAQQSAKIVDNVLVLLTSLPFVSKDAYNPEVPLNVALGQVSKSLDDLPKSISSMGTNIETTQENLVALNGSIARMASDIGEIQTSLEDAQTVLKKYQRLVADAQDVLKNLEKTVSKQVGVAVVIVTVFLIWLAVTQLGMLVEAFRMLTE